MTRALRRGERVVLTDLTAADRDEFLAAVHASTALHRPWASPPTDRAAFARYVARDPSTDRRFAVRLTANRELAGLYSLSQIFRGAFRNAYLGYYAFVPHAGQGYMREGLSLVLGLAFDTMHLHRLEANIQPGNVASISLVRGAGFRYEGVSPRYLEVGGSWRDHERWAITVEDLAKRLRPS